MDHSARMNALATAKTVIAAHGLTAHMNKYNRDLLSTPVQLSHSGIRYDFHLDPTRDSWAPHNPSCTLGVSYAADPRGAQQDESGSTVLTQHLRISGTVSGNDMTLDVMRRRENMMSLFTMLCEMLTATLPQTVVSVLETPAEAAARKQTSMEQLVGSEIIMALGPDAVKGLRRDGAARSFRLGPNYASSSGKYPDSGTYRYKHVRQVDRRGRPKDIAYYSIRVYGTDGTTPPTLSIRRVDAV